MSSPATETAATTPTILAVATVPCGQPLTQAVACSYVQTHLGDSAPDPAKLSRMYGNTRIQQRYLLNPNLEPQQEPPSSDTKPAESPADMPIQSRMELSKQLMRPFLIRTVRQVLVQLCALADSPCRCAGHSESAQDDPLWRECALARRVGQVVVVSSTGIYGPGFDCEIIDHFGLDRSVERLSIHFMGCAAANQGVQAGSNYVRAHLDKLSLVVCYEVSSLHADFRASVSSLITHALFADGVAAMMIGLTTRRRDDTAAPSKRASAMFCIREVHSYLCPSETAAGIELGIKETGITCELSPQLAQFIQVHTKSWLQGILAKSHVQASEIEHWLIHPGGPRIIENAALSLGIAIDDTHLDPSWHILREYGNMLSATLVYVLDHLRTSVLPKASQAGPTSTTSIVPHTGLGVAFSFSPGVGIDGFLFEVVQPNEAVTLDIHAFRSVDSSPLNRPLPPRVVVQEAGVSFAVSPSPVQSLSSPLSACSGSTPIPSCSSPEQ